MSVGQLDANITARAGSKRGMDLYSGNTESIKRDVSKMMELHQENIATDEFYQNKHGSRWKEYQQFINTVFGLMTKEQQSINPMFQSDSISSQKGQVYRTYRLDRISKATRMDGATSMPFHYENIKMNFLPDGFTDTTKPDTTRYLPEGKHDRNTAIKNKDVFAKRFENFKPQVGVDGVDVGWQRPSDGKFVDTGEHYNFYKDDNGNQLGNPNEIGYVRIVKEGKDLYYEGKPNPKQLRELKDTSIELGLTLIADNESIRYLPEASGKKFKPSKITARDIDEIAKEVGGGKLGKGSKKFGAFMRAMNDKEGGVNIRDVIKSYAITQSSIQRGEIANKSLRKSWPNHPFTEAKIRPEDAFAKLLQTKDGQDYLNSAEKGVYNKSAANGMIEKFKSFGLYNTLEKHLEQSVKQFYPKADELLSGIKDMPASEFIDYVQKNFKGISFGKTGFFLGNIGRGDIPTFDSRQSKLVYGEVVTNKKAVIMDQIDRLPKLGIEIPKEYEQYAQTLLHHEVWDRLNQSDTDHAPIKDTMLRYLPEGLPKNYQSNKDEGYLRSSIGIDGLMNLYRPFKSTEALPTVSMRHDYPVQDFKIFKFDKKASVVYAKNKNGVDISFKFDPLLMNKPEFADFDTKYKGMVVQLAMADRHGATDGDMGGHSFPDLKVNQDNIVTDENGKEYKLVWSNNAWGPVKNMSSKAQKFGAVTLLTYNMDPHAHDSNTRTVRIFSNEIANSGLSVKDQSTILIVQNVALKKSLTSANKADLRRLIKDFNDLKKELEIDKKIAAGSKRYKDVKKLSQADRDSLIDSINEAELLVKQEKEYLKEALGAKDASVEEMTVDKLFRDYQTKRRASEKTPKSEGKVKAMKDAEKAIRDFQKTKEFKLAEKLLPSRELDQFSNTFKGRKSLIKAIKTSIAAAKWGSFDALKISEKIGDQMTGDSMHIVSSVELSSDPNFKAVYLGEDPKEIARMTPSEKLAADKLKSNPDFVSHEAYQWSMLGPAESKHYFNTNQRSVLDSFPSFLDEYSKFPVKEKKLKLNDPNSKASEFNKVNTIRDQSKIRIVYGGTNEKQQ
jgi:thermostable 8-oxoguanine DNA glycosylase